MTEHRVRALCCVCGQLRTVSEKYTRLDDNLAYDDQRDPRHWRMTVTLKCSHCSGPARHALLRDGSPYRDAAEVDRWAKQ
jgi:hypothetical protein